MKETRAPKTTERVFGGSVINYALVIMTREVYGYSHRATILILSVVHTQGSSDG